MKTLIDSYLTYLSGHPSLINSIILWNTTNFFVWWILIRYRKVMITGAEGENGLWELTEQVSYILLWLISPILTYSAYFNADLPTGCWYLLGGSLAYTLGGRWLLQWALAFKSGSAKVETEENKTPSQQ